MQIPLFPQQEPLPIDNEIDRAISIMSRMKIGDEAYLNAAKAVNELHIARSQPRPNDIRPEILIGAAVNLLGILFVLNYEHVHVLTSKAITMVAKGVRL